MKYILCLSLFLIGFFVTANGQYQYGYTTGSSVILRSNHSTSSTKIMSLKRDESLEILDEYSPTNNTNEAILKYETKFYNSYSNDYAFKLPSGKAVKVIERLSDDRVKISYTEHGGSKGVATITTDRLEFINGDLWYKVRTASGRVGWVFGKYIQLEYGD